jgi:hypothetical protein
LSEYQYYEFLAVDRPLDDRQQAEVRRLSTRARITATSFVNEYHWGDFRGNPSTMMERFYDAHLYLANWGTRHVMLRLPRSLVDAEVAEQYCVGDQVTAWTSGKHLILSVTSEAEEESWDYEPQGFLAAIVGVRGELAAGDHRGLYLAWLAGYGTWERDESDFDDEDNDEPEPPVPPGLHPHRATTSAGRLPAPRRRPASRALARERRLDELADDEEAAWTRVAAMIATRQPGEYDNAVRLLTDLQALAERDDHPDEFTQRCAVIRQEHARKTTLIGKLDRANL